MVLPLVALIERLLAYDMPGGEVRPADAVAQAELVYNLASNTAHAAMLMDERQRADPANRHALPDRVLGFCCRALAA